ncbi:uncharacterized protein METZ01_LOCUS365037 [marine metagenome]|uniref:Uncharacterized protein n=1 Tax=marine metagenome TaxID=408172 RepID=A0A382SQU9_9ZZZZ
MDEEVGLKILEFRLEVPVGLDPLKADLRHQPLHVRLPQGKHIEMEGWTVPEIVAEPR